MAKMNRKIHKPQRAYYLRRWPVSLSFLPNQTSAEVTRISLLSWCAWAGLSKPSRLHQSGVSYQAVRHLAQSQEAKGRCNAYHNRDHIAGVIIAAGLLAQKAKLSQIQTDHLIIAALMHDYGHLGSFRNKAPFWQERKSWQQAMAILRRHGCDGRLSKQFYQWVMATSPAAHHDDFAGKDIIASLLVDADLFGSLFLAKPIVRRLSKAVRAEERLSVELEGFINKFIAQCETTGLASESARKLHAQLPAGYSYFKG